MLLVFTNGFSVLTHLRIYHLFLFSVLRSSKASSDASAKCLPAAVCAASVVGEKGSV